MSTQAAENEAARAERADRAKRRADVASAFTGFLIGLAITEAVAPVRESVHQVGLSLDNLGLFAIFFLTSTRFFIGGSIHLTKKEMLDRKGVVWFIDFVVITLECTILIFMAGVASVQASADPRVRYGFFALLGLLLVFDFVWITYQGLLRAGSKTWAKDVPWEWAILDVIVVAGILLARYYAGGLYSDGGLKLLLILNAVIFVADILLVDRADLF